MSRVSQPVLALLPAEACSVGPSAGLVEGPDGGVVFVFGLATFSFRAGDETGRRLAAVQLAATKIAPAVEVASAFGVSVATLWRWTSAVTHAGVVGLIRERSGPKGPSKLTGPLTARIVGLEAAGRTLLEIAAAADVSTATVRVALGRVTPRRELPAHHAATRPGAVAFLYLDGHVRVYTGTRQLPKTHIARMRIAGPATEETWVTDTDGDPVMVPTAAPPQSLAAELHRLLPDL